MIVIFTSKTGHEKSAEKSSINADSEKVMCLSIFVTERRKTGAILRT